MNYKQRTVSRDDHGKLYDTNFSFHEIVQYGKTIMSIFEQFSATIKNILSLEGRLGPRL